MEKVHQKLVRKIKEYFYKSNKKKAVIGLSGGIDSSLAAYLVAEAIGKHNVTGLIMPHKGLSSNESVQHAMLVVEKIGINYQGQQINKFLMPFKEIKWDQNKLALINLQSRIRAVLLYNYANTHDALVIGTSNKSEIMLGYYTKYGDGACDVEVIGSLFKTDVYELAKHLKMPLEIIAKQPSAELFHGQTDEEELGATYTIIDDILKKIAKGVNPHTNVGKKIIEMMKKTAHKRKMPEVIKI